MGRRRAWVLGAVHVVIVGHVLHWKIAGWTLSPVEPSESMRLLELGEVNAGAVFFAAAILSTAILGRFFCGWGCHVVALQDLCGWAMRRLGVRPRPLRSRLLAWVPLLLALYMFVWPTARRLVFAPLAQRLAPGTAFLARPPEFPGFSNHLLTTDFWATFPGVAIAVPFLAVCGFAVVYLLGSKGFCTYGCPYGAFFGAAEQIAPGRIRVSDACNGCGHCTAVCTSNVRVHEEVRRYGMVTDPGCMKCLDCVGTCPTDALRWGFGPLPARGADARGRTVRADLGGRGEIALAATFLAAFFAWRGAYGAVPLLMAVGLALCVAALLLVTTGLLRDRDVSLQGGSLKREGRWRIGGALVATTAAIAALLTAQAGAVGALRFRAEALDTRVTVSREDVLAGRAPTLSAGTRRTAERAVDLYRLADGFRHGGLGLAGTAELAVRRAWLALVLGRPDEAVAHLERGLGSRPRADAARLDLARVRALAGRTHEALDDLRALVAERPTDVAAHRALADIREAAGDRAGAAAALIVVVNLDAADAQARRRLAELLASLGRADEAARYR